MGDMVIKAIGLDPGFGQGKAALVRNGKVETVIVPNMLCTWDGREHEALGGGLRAASRPPVVSVNGSQQQFLVGPGAEKWGRPLDGTDFNRLTGTEAETMAAYLFARLLGDVREAHVERLSIGLPVMNDPKQARRYRDRLRAMFTSDALTFKVDGDSYRLTFGKVGFMAQPAAALNDYFLTDGGGLREDRSQDLSPSGARDLLGVISLGHRTVDLVLTQSSEVLPMGTQGTDYGVRNLLERVATRFPGFSLAELDLKLQAGSLGSVAEEREIWVREIANIVSQLWESLLPRMAQIIAVGGGTRLVTAWDAIGLPSDRVHVPDDPIGSIARGLLKTALGQATT